jgi:DNA-binding transcriptional regulator YhcF (GntR family)
MVGGGDDPRLPSNRSREQIATETNRRTVQRAFRNLDFASSLMREVIAGISTLPDTKSNQALHRHASAIEERIRHLQSLVSEVRR